MENEQIIVMGGQQLVGSEAAFEDECSGGLGNVNSLISNKVDELNLRPNRKFPIFDPCSLGFGSPRLNTFFLRPNDAISACA
jgi:hypothetical protein